MKREFITVALLAALSTGTFADGPRAERLIGLLDENGDGLVSIDEFNPPRVGPSMLDRADTDGDGVVTVEELKARHAERIQRLQERIEKRNAKMIGQIESMDRDGDGAVTSDESRLAVFERMDENGDGFVSADEFRPPERLSRQGPGRGYHRRPGR